MSIPLQAEPDQPSLAEAAPAPATPFRRLVAAIMVSNAAAVGALIAPMQLLITVHLIDMVGPGGAAAFGIVTGAGAVASLIANPLAGRLSDRTTARFGRRRTWILAGATAGSLVLAVVPFTTALWQVLIVWVLVQALFNVQQAATSALLADQVPPHRRGAVSGLLGFVVAIFPLLVLAGVTLVSDDVVRWLICAGVGAAGGILAVVLLRERRYTLEEGAPRLSVRQLLGSYWLDPRRHPAFAWAWITRFLVYCAFANTFAPFFYIERFGLDTDGLGSVIVVITVIAILCIAVTSVASGLVSDRIRRQKPFVIAGAVLSSASLVTTLTAPSLEVVYLSTAIGSIGGGLIYAVDNALCVRVLPDPENLGKDYAIINLASGLPASIVPFVGAGLLGLGGFPLVYLLLAGLGLLGALTVLRVPEIGREDDPRFAAITKG